MPPSGGPPGGGPGGPEQGGGDDGYTTEEDGATFESDRRFSNFVMFLGSFIMVVIFAASNVVSLKR